MPNIQTKTLPPIPLPFSKNGYLFEYQTKINNSKSLIMVSYHARSFFLEIIKREKNYLIRAEKLTRFSPVFIIQDALGILASHLELTLEYQNIKTKKNSIHLQNDDKFLKKIDYFVDEFIPPLKTIVEIGFGSGRHLLYQAKQNPDTTYIGIEIHKPSIEQVIKQCKLQSIENILLLDYDARIFLELLPSLTLDKIYLHFPVPWDKKPNRRVISRGFLDECSRVLKKDSSLELRTDSQNYYDYTFSLINSYKEFDIEIKKNHQLSVCSKYEDRWIKQEKNIYDFHIINSIPSLKERCEYKIEFDKQFYKEFKKFAKDFKKTILKQKKCFVHFENIYFIDDDEGIIKVTLGSYQKSEHKYIVFKDKRVQYFPNKLIPVKNNFDAHKLIVNHIKKVEDV